MFSCMIRAIYPSYEIQQCVSAGKLANYFVIKYRPLFKHKYGIYSGPGPIEKCHEEIKQHKQILELAKIKPKVTYVR